VRRENDKMCTKKEEEKLQMKGAIVSKISKNGNFASTAWGKAKKSQKRGSTEFVLTEPSENKYDPTLARS